ncbi:Uncharacterised protein [uncultured archaeon]|nr:Uncharacterised protein [uncultured archaeon]
MTLNEIFPTKFTVAPGVRVMSSLFSRRSSESLLDVTINAPKLSPAPIVVTFLEISHVYFRTTKPGVAEMLSTYVTNIGTFDSPEIMPPSI